LEIAEDGKIVIKLPADSGLKVGDVVFFYIYSSPAVFASGYVQQDAAGELFVKASLPAGYSGKHEIAVTDKTGHVITYFTRELQVDPVTGKVTTLTTPAELSTTGVNAAIIGGVIILLLLAGAGAFIASRKKATIES
jgi:hypothetical protein